jgi:hypothetical protein
MPFEMCHQNVDERDDVWHIEASGGLATAKVWPTRAIGLEWQDGTREAIPARFGCLVLPNATETTVDLTTQDYYVVVGKGQPVPWLVLVTDSAALDTIVPHQPWSILRVLGKWGSAPYWPGTALSAGVQGDILRYEHGAWQTLPIGAVGDLLHVVTGPYGLQPVWVPASSVVTPFLPSLITLPGSGQVYHPESGGLPTGWYTTTFDAAGWLAAVAANAAVPEDTGDTAAWISYTGDFITSDTALIWGFRGLFNVPAGATSVILTIKGDNYIDSVWVNGASISVSGDWGGTNLHNAPATATIPLTSLFVGSPNLIAVQVRNEPGSPGVTGPTAMFYSIATS